MNDTTALVLGLGESGLAMARWLARDGGAVRVWDSRTDAAAGTRRCASMSRAPS